MSFVNISVIINDKNIYTLRNNKPIVIPLFYKDFSIVASDGYHITVPVNLKSQHDITYLKVACTIDNDRLIAGIIIILLSSLVGIISDILVAKLVSFLPIFYFLFLYYWKRRAFIQIKKV